MVRALLFIARATALTEEPARVVTFGRSYLSDPLPASDKGYLLFLDHSNGVEVWGPDGQLAFQTRVNNPLSSYVMSAAIDRDGSVAVGLAYDRSGGIAVLDRSGKQVRFTETGRYLPAHICFDSNHNLWTFGWQRDGVQSDAEDAEDYMLFRKYSPDGKQLGAFVSRSLFPRPGLSPGSPSGGLWRLRVSDDRVGAVAYAGRTSETHEWIELSLEGRLIGRWKTGPGKSGGMAFTSSNALCRQRIDHELSQLECFDRESKAWKPSGNDSPYFGILLGADGNDLIFGSNGGNIRLNRVPTSLQ